ncbi:MAG TPA: hypothetical protein VJV78_23155 [Polyangiales bacterium]|nr:hypothetical protein [Polyangiales bacterium]
MTRASLTYLTALLLLGTAGCTVHTHGYHDYDDYDDYDHHPYDGVLTIDWSLDDSFDSDECDHYDADSVELIVYEGGHDEVLHLQRRCDDFETSIDLPDGVYSLDATLLDHSDRRVTTTLALDDIDIYDGEETRISIDFPLDSRL